MRTDVALLVIVTLLMYITIAFIVNTGTDSGVVVAGTCVAAVASLVPSIIAVKMLLYEHPTASGGMALAMLVGILATIALGAFAIVYPGSGERGWAIAATTTSAVAGVVAAAWTLGW